MFDLGALAEALAAHGRVARVVVAGVEGHAPREVGAAMLVWNGGQSGTIGGGALEHQAVGRALEAGPFRVDRVALGPGIGQCCGGAVVLVTEVYEALPVPVDGLLARGPGVMPLAVKRRLAAARGQGVLATALVDGWLVDGWLVEPVATPVRQVWVWGAGHVGRALVAVLAPLPGLSVTWVDVSPERFPTVVPDGVDVVVAADPAVLVAHAPVGAEHLIVTFSHALDLELCHRLLQRGFAFCGLIGSATKWGRFRSRLMALGHAAAAVGRITCPIGEPGLGKHPQAIAVGVAAAMLRTPVAAVGERRA